MVLLSQRESHGAPFGLVMACVQGHPCPAVPAGATLHGDLPQ